MVWKFSYNGMWSDLWLNEGFYMYGWLAIDNIFPHWDVWTNFTNDAGYDENRCVSK